MDDRIRSILATAEQDPAVLAVILFGSRSRGEARATSDVDVCLVLEPPHASSGGILTARERYLPFMNAGMDVHVYQQLPIYIRHRVLKDGQVLSCKDEGRLYDVAYRTVRDYETYKPYYRRYLEQVAGAGS